MHKQYDARAARARRRKRVRATIHGTAARPRLAIFRSNEHIYAQVIDDDRGHTLIAANTLEPTVREQAATAKKIDNARMVGRLLAERAQATGIKQVIFDRGGFLYHGRIEALANAAREGGLEF